MNKLKMNHVIVLSGVILGLGMGIPLVAMADSTATLGTMASNISATLASVGRLITGASYIAGLAFAIGAIMKFKQHKDNPTQTPIGAPIGLLVVAAALLFMPSVMHMAGATLFGTGASTAGSSGVSLG